MVCAESSEKEQKAETGKERKKKNRPTKSEMDNRNRIVTMAVAEIQQKYGRWPNVGEVIDKIKLPAQQIYATAPYKENKIAKSSAKLTEESTGRSVTPSEQFKEKTIEHSRADRQSKSDQAELDSLIDQQQEDNKSDFVS